MSNAPLLADSMLRSGFRVLRSACGATAVAVALALAASAQDASELSARLRDRVRLQTELAAIVGSLDVIEDCHVIVARPEDGGRASATVAVRIRAGRTLDAAGLRNIQRLVAHSVPGLATDAVAVADGRTGAILASPAAPTAAALPDALAWKRAIEAYYEEKAARLLAPAFRRPPVAVVDVEIDADVARRAGEAAGAPPAGEAAARTPGLVRRRSLAVAVPDEEIGDPSELAAYRRLLIRALDLKAEDLEIFALPYRVGAAGPAPLPAAGWVERAAGVASRHAAHLVWAGVAIVVAGLAWSVARRIAARPAAPMSVRRIVTQAPTPGPDLASEVRALVAADPVRAADAIRGLLGVSR